PMKSGAYNHVSLNVNQFQMFHESPHSEMQAKLDCACHRVRFGSLRGDSINPVRWRMIGVLVSMQDLDRVIG
ncbi:MAG: hypothetical protein Q9174_005879, partial [Haloplaca sp. 1 TL-2023]